MRATVVIPVFLALAVSAPADPTRETPQSGPLKCILTAEPSSQVGRIPSVAVEIINQTDTDIYLVGNLDGSSVGLRYPHCYFKLIGPDGKPVHYPFHGCANVNPLLEDDFVRVPPGDAFDPFKTFDSLGQLIPRNFQVPGLYHIQFVYSTASDSIGDWAGFMNQDVAGKERLTELLQRVPKLEVTSNEVVVNVVESEER